MERKRIIDTVMDSAIFAVPLVYIALVVGEIDDVPDLNALDGLVFLGVLVIGSVLLSLAATAVRLAIRR